MRRKLLTGLAILITSGICFNQAVAQTLKPGKSYMLGPYVEYVYGNMPLIISVPHGGYEKPDSIPERVGKFAKNQDIYTIEIACEISKKIGELTGYHPHIVINHLHRTRLDANRNIDEAANGNPVVEKVWHIYQSQLDSLAQLIDRKYGKGLFIDLHGHRHQIERMELGYLLSADELRLEDEMLNSGLLDEYSSIRHLITTNNHGSGLADLIRGKNSLGALLTKHGQACMPSPEYRMPGSGEAYFSGGYNTMQHGSSHGGNIDGIQIEVDLQTRSNKRRQQKVSHDVALALVEFLRIHYFPEL